MQILEVGWQSWRIEGAQYETSPLSYACQGTQMDLPSIIGWSLASWQCLFNRRRSGANQFLHVPLWQHNKVCFLKVVGMCHASKKDCDNILTEYNLNLDKNLNIAKWKEEVIEEAKAEELVSTARQSSSERETLKCQIEMLSFSLAQRTTAISKQADSSKQRTGLRKKLTSEKKTLQKLIDECNKVITSTAEEPLTFEGVISGELLDNADNIGGGSGIIGSHLFIISLIFFEVIHF